MLTRIIVTCALAVSLVVVGTKLNACARALDANRAAANAAVAEASR